MKIIKQYLLYSLFPLLSVISFSACSDDNDNITDPAGSEDYTELIKSYVDETVVATYSEMKTNALLLKEAVQTFKDNSSQENLNQACELWKSTRKPWEQSEAFLFGPAAFLSLDPSLDSWPLDQSQLEEVLKSNFELTPAFIKEGLGFTLRGFHTVEFLLFRNGSPRDAASVTEREKEYLVAVTEVLYDDAALLHDEWDGGFASEFKNSGQSGSRYISQESAVHEIIEGVITIADEVANGKIAEPYNTKDKMVVESQFSWNSLIDFENNIRGIQNAYLGGYDGNNTGSGLSVVVKEKNESLDTRIKSEITAAINAIKNIPSPFENNLGEAAKIEAAMAACNKIMETFQNDVKPLISE
jgi:uncharacterized iron-regulated protein